MNNISLIIYLAGVIAKLGVLFQILTTFTCILFVGFLCRYIFLRSNGDVDAHDRRYEYTEAELEARADTRATSCWKTWGRWNLTAAVIFIPIVCLIPSERTMWLIAGSQVTDVAINSEAGSKVVDIITGKLDDALTDLASERTNGQKEK